MNEELTDEESSYLTKMFWKNHEQIQDKLREEVGILSKYKGELAREYAQARGYQNTIADLMKEILERQEQLIFNCQSLESMALRIEKFFLDDVPPKVNKCTNVIDRSITIDKLFDGYVNHNSYCPIPTRSINCLLTQEITHLYMLQGKDATDIGIIEGIGQESLAIIIYLAEKKGIEIPFRKSTGYSRARSFLKEFRQKDVTEK